MQTTAVALWLLVAAVIPASAATPTEFYVSLLRRGAADVELGEYVRATTPLRIAAFGLVDTLEHYQTAQVYLTIASDRLGRETAARDAARRALAAERIERRYASLALPPATRQAFEAAAKKLLGPTETAVLFAGRPATSAQPSMTSTSTPATVRADLPAAAKADPPAAAKESPSATVNFDPPATARPAPATVDRATPAAEPRPSEPAPATPSPSLPSVVPAGAPAIEARLEAAAQAVDAGRLADARTMFRAVLEADGFLARPLLIRVGEGLYRSRDFEGVLAAFQRIGAFRSGEEPYRYYIAVALYETGAFDAARAELAGAIPFIEVTPDVARYREKIEAGGR